MAMLNNQMVGQSSILIILGYRNAILGLKMCTKRHKQGMVYRRLLGSKKSGCTSQRVQVFTSPRICCTSISTAKLRYLAFA